ncbi:MAG: glycosyltransferase family 2 protein, partial [Candidatus Ranarchaeia archaeon]
MIDLIMWTYNGSKTLEKTLPQIEKVIPEKDIRKKIASDDNSDDDTTEVLRQYGWEVHLNPGPRGIGFNANNALSYSKTEFIACFEQDVLLADNWWKELSVELVKPENQDVAQFLGVRIPNIPTLKKFHEYRLKKLLRIGKPPLPLDQTICRKSALNDVGNFPYVPFAGMDSILSRRLQAKKWRFLVKPNIISTHLRSSIAEELHHFYQYGKAISYLDKNITEKTLRWKYYTSYLTALKIAIVMRDLSQLSFYPRLRKNMLL